MAKELGREITTLRPIERVEYKHWSNLALVGTEMYNPQENSVTGEVIGTGDGSTTSFSATLANTPVEPKSLTVHYTIGGTAYTGTDDGEGNITGTDIDSGTINYDTGEVSLTFSTAPDDGTNITADYKYYTNGTGNNVSKATDGYVHITISGIVSSTVYILPAINGIDMSDEQLVYTSDVDEVLPVKFVGGTLRFGAYRTGSDYITLTIEEVRRE